MLALVLLLGSSSAHADDRTRAVAAAAVPGLVLHGSGHWVMGQKRVARTLLLTEAAGLGAMGSGASILIGSGFSRKLVAPASGLVILGVGLFLVSFLADLEGTIAPPLGEPRVVLPIVETSLGYRYVSDPVFAYRSFVATGLDLRVGKLRVSPEGWFGAGHPNERLRLAGAYRFAGPTTKRARDGSFVDAEVAGIHHAFPPERFSITSLELMVAGRLDLARIGSTLRGSFVDAALGYGLARHRYAVRGSPEDGNDQLLARVGYGVWIGRPTSTWAEVSAFYEHRHDGFAGGLDMPGTFSGVPGNFGARAITWLTEDLGASLEAQFGHAFVAGASVLVRQPISDRR